ncbi:MAG: hypothetical protein HOP20_00010 [Sulfuriferula sp.]|nr:hypothetical protein [Sulfuriferula sp.]
MKMRDAVYSFIFEPEKAEKLLPEVSKTNKFYEYLQRMDDLRISFVDFSNWLLAKAALILIFGFGLVLILFGLKALIA